jgi:hypothetical protein
MQMLQHLGDGPGAGVHPRIPERLRNGGHRDQEGRPLSGGVIDQLG